MGSRKRIIKSTRHSKLTGDFGEHLVLYYLSKYGFECARVDHTGIDIIARRPKSDELMGISVKSRSRTEGKEGTSVSVGKDNTQKAEDACKQFKCVPYLAVVADCADKVMVYIIKMDTFKRVCPGLNWSMSRAARKKYADDGRIIKLELDTSIVRWW